MLEIIIIISLCILIAGGFSLSIGVMRKDSKYMGNRLFALSTACLGVYGICILTYQLLPLIPIIESLERAGYVFAISCTFFLYLSMQFIAHSKDWLTQKSHVWPAVIFIAVYFIALFSWPGIITILGYNPVNTALDTVFSIILGVIVFYFVVSSLIVIFKYGLHNAEAARRKRMLFAITGLAIITVALVLNTASDLVENVSLGSMIDAIFFRTLCTGTVFVSIGFIGRPNGS